MRIFLIFFLLIPFYLFAQSGLVMYTDDEIYLLAQEPQRLLILLMQ